VALLPVLPSTVATELTGTEPLLVQLGSIEDGLHLLVVVDQAEELFTVCTDETERGLFVDGLVAAAANPGGRIDVVLTVRADYYGRFAGDQRLATAIAANQVLVGPMTAEEYRRAITRPAQRHGVTVEPELVDALVDEVTGQPGALPLLSTSLLELWEARTDRTMTLASYQATGGLHAAVARLAESVYTSLDPDQQQAARRMFLRLTGPGAGDSVVKRRVRLSDLATDGESSALVDLLARRRLLTVDDGAVEVAHEALLREWPRFTDWLEEDREGIRLRAHLADAAANWEAVDRDTGELYRGARLSATLDWTTAHAQDLSPVEQEFVTASSTEHQRATAHQHRQNRRLRGLLTGAAVLLVLALIAGAIAAVQSNRAARNAEEARTAAEASRQAAVAADAQRVGARSQLSDDISLSLLLAAAGARLDDSPETRVNLLAALARRPNLVRSAPAGGGYLEVLSVSPDGRFVAASDDANRMHLYDATTNRLLRSYDAGKPPGDGQAWILGAFSPDSRQLAVILTSVESTEPVRLLDPDTMRPTVKLASPGSEPVTAFDAQFSADGRYLAATILTDTLDAEDDPLEIPSDAVVWDLRSPSTPPTRFPIGTYFQGLALSPDGRTLYTGWPLTAYDVISGDSIWREPALNTGYTSLDVNAKGTLLAVHGPDGTSRGKDVLLVDVEDGTTVARLRGHRDQVSNIRFSPDGTLVGSVAWDGELIVWDTATRRPLGRWETFDEWGVGFGPDNDLVYGGGGDSMLRTWDVSRQDTYLQQTTQVSDAEVFADADVSPDGQQVAYSWRDDEDRGWVRFVDTVTGDATSPARFPADEGDSYQWATWHPRGGQYVGYWCLPCETPGTVTVLDSTTGKLIQKQDIVDGDGNIYALAFYDQRSLLVGAGGRELPIGGSGARTLIVDAETLQPRGEPFGITAHNIASIGDGSTAMVYESSTDQASVRWRVIDVSSADVLSEGDLNLNPYAFVASPDGSTVAAAGATGEIVTIDVSAGDQRRSSNSLGAEVRWLNYSDDGELLVSGAADGGVSLWDAATLDLLGTVYPPNDGEAVPAGAQFIGDTHDVAIASYDGRVYRWETDVERAIDFACQMAGRSLTEDEWEEFLPEQPYRDVCPRQ
jgi:WD40 repeat protein